MLRRLLADSACLTAAQRSATPVDIQSSVNRFYLGTTTVLRPYLFPNEPLYIDDSSDAGGVSFNPAAFRTPAVSEGRQGTLGRNVLRGFPAHQVDMSLRRNFSLTERLNLQFRADASNICNHPNFANPSGILTNPNFGRSLLILGTNLGGLS